MKERFLVPFLFKSYNHLFSRRLLSKQGHQNRSGDDARASRGQAGSQAWSNLRGSLALSACQAVVFRPQSPQSPGLRVLAPQRPPRGSGVLCPACLAIPDLPTPSAPNLPPPIPAYPSSPSLPRGLPAYSACSQHALNVPSMPLWTRFSRHSFRWHEPFILHPRFSERQLALALVWPARGRCCLPNRGRMHPQGMAAGEGQWLSPALTKKMGCLASFPLSLCVFELVHNKKLWKIMFFRSKIDWRYRSQIGRRYFHESNPRVVILQTI